MKRVPLKGKIKGSATDLHDEDNVETRLGQVRVEMGHALGEHRDVLRQTLVRVLEPGVQIGHGIVGLVLKGKLSGR